MPDAPESADPARRWRLIATGLAIVGATNLINLALNTASLRETPPMACIAIAADGLSKEAIEQRVDRGLRGLVPPHIAALAPGSGHVEGREAGHAGDR